MSGPCHEYTCARCGGTFHSNWSDADAVKEYEALYSAEMRAEGQGPPVLICDDCHKEMLATYPIAQAWEDYQARKERRDRSKKTQ